MAETERVSDSSAASAEYEAVKGVNLEKYDRLKHLLSWDEKQSLFKWKGSLEELQNFSKEIIESDVSPMCISDRSSSLKSKLVTLVLFNNARTLQIQGPESTDIKNAELRKLLSLPAVHKESVILVSEEDAAILSEPYNCHEKLHLN